MKFKWVIGLILLGLLSKSIAQICSPTPLQIGAPDNNTSSIDGGGFCDLKINVVDEKPYINCSFDADVFYPVFTENGNYKEDLPNNFRFQIPYRNDDINGSYPQKPKGYSWLADAYINNNVYTNNGKIVLEWKKQTKYGPVVPGGSIESFPFTGGILWSLFKVKGGFFISKIKLPENAHFWPAYWLYNNQEIDIFEFADNYLDHGICDTYHHWKINIHGYNDNWLINQNQNGHCNRNRKLKVCNDFFDNYHEFKLFWSNYLIQINDGSNYIAYATKYFNSVNRFNTGGGCHTDISGGGTPNSPYTCNSILSLQDCDLWAPWPWNNECWRWNKIMKDVTFPMTSIPMEFIISNGVNSNSGNAQQLYNTWDNYSLVDKQILIDYIVIYQPIKCYTDFQVLNEPHFKSITGGTNFLSGRKLSISNGSGTNLYINESPKPSNNWHEFPTHILATEEIAFLNEVAFEEGTFLRAEIIDCNTGIGGVSQRMNPDNNSALPPVLPIDYFDQQDTITKQLFPDKPTISETDNGAIQIHPNPTPSHIHISMPEEDWNDLTHIYLITPLGVKTELPKAEVQDFSHLPNGMYFLQFHFSNGMMVVKNVIKQE